MLQPPAVCLVALCLFASTCDAVERPNILWLSCEDISAHLGCYGDDRATTPHLDAFAKQAVRYSHAFVTAGVCAPCRSAIITGMYQTSIGTQHMRCTAQLPARIRPFTMWLREAGYYCANNSKTDYQFQHSRETWDASSGKAHWKNRPEGAPFFAVFNYTGCHESGIASSSKYKKVTAGIPPHDRSVTATTLPPYYPDTPETRDDWGRYYDVITAMDRWVNDHLRQLQEAELADDTIVFFWSDHGVGLPRAKRWLYDSGMHVPLIVRIPEKWRRAGKDAPGTVSDQLISLIDLGPTVLKLAGVSVPETMQGRPFLGDDLPAPREYVYGARDRMDERYDIIRAVRDQRYKYIRNYEPFKTYYQYMNTPEKGRTMQAIREAQQAPPAPGVAQFLVPNKPVEELYDCLADPHEMQNLADSPQHQQVLTRMRRAHLQWVIETRDLGLIPEAMLRERAATAGSEWEVLQGETGRRTIEKIRDAAALSLATSSAIEPLRKATIDPEPAVRYWAAVGLGNLGMAAQSAQPALQKLLQDNSANVRVAAARALCRMNQPHDALPVLVKVLDHGQQWARVHAAVVLDELNEQARPVIDDMKRNKAYRDGFVARGKYTVRVLNRALNELEGTNHTVP